jgi:hypothetical protein
MFFSALILRLAARRFPGRAAFLFFALAVFPAMPQAAEQIDLGPTEFKAALLSKLPAYVQWPAASFESPADPLVIGVLGDAPFQPLLEQLLADKKFHGRDVVVKHFPDFRGLQKCQILFVPAALAPQWQQARPGIDPFGLLVVGEGEEMFRHGGVFALSIQERKMAIHVRNANQAGLKIDSRLLRISKVIRN